MQLSQALTFVQDRVKTIFATDNSISSDEIMLDVLDKDNVSEGIYISLLYAEEEKTLRNNSYMQTYYRDNNPINEVEGYRKVNPKLYMNLYVMIVSTKASYQEAIKQISRIISAFQAKNVFLSNREVVNENGTTIVNEFGRDKNLLDKLVFEINTLTFEQNNSLWQTLGGKIHPYIIYKVKVVAFAEARTESDMVPIDTRVALVKPVNRYSIKDIKDCSIGMEGSGTCASEVAEYVSQQPQSGKGVIFIEKNEEYDALKKQWNTHSSIETK